MDIFRFFAANQLQFIIVVALFSSFVGSFLNVVIYRLPMMLARTWDQECRHYLGLKPQPEPDKLNLCLPPSHCPNCKSPIRPWHNIPIIGYLLLRGRCADCRTAISIRYLFVEVLTCLASVYVAWRFGCSWQTVGALLFTWTCIALTFIDLDHQLLPDQLTLFLLWIGLFLSIFTVFTNSHDAIIGAIAGYCIFAGTQWLFEWVTGRQGMGQGDLKFLAAIGAFVGWQAIPMIILLASISGILIAVTQMIIRRNFKSIPLPFGPYLAIAGWIALMWGNDILHYYLQIM